jgi:hypothetical protein
MMARDDCRDVAEEAVRAERIVATHCSAEKRRAHRAGIKAA